MHEKSGNHQNATYTQGIVGDESKNIYKIIAYNLLWVWGKELGGRQSLKMKKLVVLAAGRNRVRHK